MVSMKRRSAGFIQSKSETTPPSAERSQPATMSNPLWQKILELYFSQADGKQIISHQLESFNHFMGTDIHEIITMVNPVIVRGSPEIPLSGPRSALASATGLSTSAANSRIRISGIIVTNRYVVTSKGSRDIP